MTSLLHRISERLKAGAHKTANYLNKLMQKMRLERARLIAEYQVAAKTKELASTALDVAATGAIIWLAVKLWPHPVWSFLSYGIAAALVIYYLTLVREIIVNGGKK